MASKGNNKTSSSMLFNRYIWIVNTLAYKDISLRDLQEKWLNCDRINPDRMELPRETFFRYRKAIEEMFNLSIKCNLHHEYFIDKGDDDQDNKLSESLRRWMFDSFTIKQMYEHTQALKKRIFFEDVRLNYNMMINITEAMSTNKEINIAYHKFDSNEKSYLVKPYCLKNFRQRWYMVAKCNEDGKIRIFSLDRIKKVETTKKEFKMPEDFDAEKFFLYSYGIIVSPDKKPGLIKIRVDQHKANYLRSLPLHLSQEEKGIDDDGKTIFSYYLNIEHDFIMELLSHGQYLEVIHPVEFRDQFKGIVARMNEMYQ